MLSTTDTTLLGSGVGLLSDDELLARSRRLAEWERSVQAAIAEVAAEIAYRSRRDLGYEGLAQRLGQRTPEKLLQTLTGSTARDARHLVAVGELMTSAAPAWLGEVGRAVEAGTVTVAAAEAIKTGLGDPTDSVTAEELEAAVTELLAQAPSTTVEALAKNARFLRDELDTAGVADREREQYEKRSWRLTERRDGSGDLYAHLDPESLQVFKIALDGATSPRRGGPRFIDPDAKEQAQRITDDARTTDQIALDAMVEIVRLGLAADPQVIVGPVRSVNILTTARDLTAEHGVGFFEGTSTAVSKASVERAMCDAGVREITLTPDGEVLNLGREQRLFSRRQRIALAARDGGCVFPGCDRPPSWCEAHHINLWSRNGTTDLDCAVLVCRHHHLLLHNNGWEIRRNSTGRLELVPPRSVDPAQTPTLLETRSAAVKRLIRTG